MGRVVSDQLLSELSKFIAERVGLHFPKERWQDLERGIVSATGDLGCQEPESCVRRLLASPLVRRDIEILSSHLTVGETYFFREKATFESLRQHLLPALIRVRRNDRPYLRIWSAGCSTGEEPYSVAILLTELLSDLGDWNITILATDINAASLRKGAAGLYKEWSFRDVAPDTRKKYFTRTNDGCYEIAPRVKKLVTFAYLNLADDVYPALENNTNAMDIILCRNVLMYFEPERAKRVVERFNRALVDGGWLIVSPAEASHTLFPQFVTTNFPGAILYRKDAGAPAGRPATTAVSSDLYTTPETSLHPPVAALPELVAPAAEDLGRFLQAGVEENKPAAPERTFYREALDLYEQGRYAEAAERASLVLSQNPDDARAMGLLARIHANQGALAEALECCKKAVAVDKLNAEWRYLLATVLQEQGRQGEALMALRHALYLDPNHALAHFALGNLSRREGKSGESERHYRNALSVLDARRPDEALEDAAGITAGRLTEIIRSTIRAG